MAVALPVAGGLHPPVSRIVMRRRLGMGRWPRQVLLIAMVALTLAIGLCLFDDEMSSDVCCVLAIFSVAVFLAALGPVHTLSTSRFCAVYAVSLRRLDPPPKSPSFA